jgi:hypothetical protein
MRRWEDALDALLDTYVFTVERAERYYEAYAESLGRKGLDLRFRSLEGDTATAAGSQGVAVLPAAEVTQLRTRVAASLFNADPFHVEPEMMDLWESAFPSFQPEPLRRDDLIVENGFIWLPRPLALDDLHGKRTSARAIAWAPARVVLHHDGEDQKAFGPPGRAADGVLLMLFHRIGDIDDYEPDFHDVLDGRAGVRRGDLVLDHAMPWLFGASYDDDPVLRPAQCLFRLIAQTITVHEEMRPARPWRRRMKKAAMPERNLTVVRLRRPRRPPDEDSEKRHVDWSVRWVVSGHWRNQWFPAKGEHRQMWISPYVKGPEDAPLRVRKARVFDWAR